MLNIIDSSLEDFYESIKGRDLIVYGAGNRAKILYDYWELEKKIKFFVDKDTSKKDIDLKDEKIPVISKEKLFSYVDKKKMVLLISVNIALGEIIDELNSCLQYDGVECYVASFILQKYEKQDFEFTIGKKIIPKKIHYCWFGNTKIPDNLKRCIESWYKYCPDYEIVLWNENNYDITKNQYMKEAYDCKQWGYVSDYASLDIIYEEGGIYLDTDVELLTSLDALLCDEMFWNMFDNSRSGFGLGFGAIKNHKLIEELRNYYNNKHFLDKGEKNKYVLCYEFQDPVLKKFGFDMKNIYQKKERVVCYPSEVMNPLGCGYNKNFTSKTVSIHHSNVSWMNEKDKKMFENTKKMINWV